MSAKNIYMGSHRAILLATALACVRGNLTAADSAVTPAAPKGWETTAAAAATLTRGNSEENMKTKAYDAYDNGRYADAIPYFKDILKTNDDPISHLCLGNAQLGAGQFAEAEATFTNMLEEHTDLVTQAKWYLALPYLKQAKMERAKATLWEISKSSTYGEKANKLLKELD